MKAATYYSWRFLPDAGISIHAAREGGDLLQKLFVPDGQISIHAAREGGDFYFLNLLICIIDFNPRRP